MDSPEFQSAMARLIENGEVRPTAILCAETVPWRSGSVRACAADYHLPGLPGRPAFSSSGGSTVSEVRMSFAQMLLPEFDNEMKTTRRVLERVPEDKMGWKPHEKSMSLGRLAGLGGVYHRGPGSLHRHSLTMDLETHRNGRSAEAAGGAMPAPPFREERPVKKDAQKEKPRRLTLNRETIRQLDDRILQALAGASDEGTDMCIVGPTTSYTRPTISG
jgi:hypothetical protein